MRQVVVTGIGLATPLGATREKSWNALIEGQSACQIKKYPPVLSFFEVPGTLSEPRTLSLAMMTVQESLLDSGLKNPELLGEKFGNTFSCSKPVLSGNRSLKINYPYEIGYEISSKFKISGPTINVISACSTGVTSVAIGMSWIRDGRCDVVLAGVSESSLNQLYLSGFQKMGVLSKQDKIKPFDKNRDGFIIGEGSAALILEEKEHAMKRGAEIYGELCGYAMGNDDHDSIHFDETGRNVSNVIRRALENARLSSEEIDYINAHGTATILNDSLEINALNMIFSKNKNSVYMSSTKAAIGHLLGAAGFVEFAFCLLGLKNEMMPATLNLEDSEETCKNIKIIKGPSLKNKIKNVMSLSFGFGGQIGVLVAGRN